MFVAHTVRIDAPPREEATNLTLSLESSGPLAPLLMIALGRIFRRNTRQEAEGMKAYCEREES